MTTRQTSIDVFSQIKAEGLLTRMRWEVYKVVFQHGPMTISEAFKVLEVEIPNLNWNTRTRFTELREMGVLYETQTRKCNVTGRTVIEWDVNSNLPSKSEPRRRPRDLIDRQNRDRIAHLEERNRELRERNAELVRANRSLREGTHERGKQLRLF